MQDAYTDEDIQIISDSFKKAIDSNNSITSHISFDKLYSKGDHCVAELFGGLNGRGKWDIYFNILSNLVCTLRTYYGIECWLVEIKCDSIDDVFYAKFGLSLLEENIINTEEDQVDKDIYDISQLAQFN